jgi:rubrerythrin
VIRKKIIKKETVSEMFTLYEIYDLAIQIEKNGEDYYRDAEKKVSDPSLKTLFLRLADQEVKHRTWFSERKESSKSESATYELDEMSSQMLKEILGNQRFSLEEVEIEQINGTEDLLSIAIELEEDTIIFYGMLRSLIEDDETLKGLDEIIEEEKLHIEVLQNY